MRLLCVSKVSHRSTTQRTRYIPISLRAVLQEAQCMRLQDMPHQMQRGEQQSLLTPLRQKVAEGSIAQFCKTYELLPQLFTSP